MRRLFSICLLLLYPTLSMAEDVLSARFPDHLGYVQVSLCFDGAAPEQLYRHQQASAFSGDIFHEGKRLETSAGKYSLQLPALPEDACISWQTNFTAALKEKDYRLILKTGQDLSMSADLWFWKGPMSRDLVVDIQLPEGMSISTPWRELERKGNDIRFRPDKTSANWEARIALGTFEVNPIKIPGANIRLAAIGNLSTRQKSKLKKWIEESVASVTAVNGHLPQSNPQVLVVAIGSRNEAVVHGQVLRGGGLATVFYIDETRPLDEFREDWTATHEFSHMLIPYISTRDRWLSEGLASYYQNVLRARDGRLSETQAWQNLYDGFKRGENNTHGGSLAQATRNGRRSTMRVYWSGAALMLMADIQLRHQSGGLQSLDTALNALSDCCMENGKTWRAREMFAQLDRLTRTEIFMEIYQDHVHANDFPDVQPIWDNLGIHTRHKQVILSEDAPLVNVRDAIMEG
jgi:predicted metalloprotease with PDZ domain